MRNIIITGGELFNKGAQAMTFIAVNEIRKRFPEHAVYVLSEMDLERPEEEKARYTFNFTGWYPIKLAHCQRNWLLRTVCLLRNKAELREAEEIYRHCDAMIDISGYALGPESSDWTKNRYLDHIEFAKCFNIPMYILSQSFDLNSEKADIDKRCRELLPTAKVILAREQEGYDALVNTYGLTNVRLAPDLVLNNKGIDLALVYREVPAIELPPIKEHSVAVIPNNRNFEVGDPNAVLACYESMIREALSGGKHVYVFGHSAVDEKVCEGIKACFAEDDRVVWLRREFSCVEFNELVKKFDFLIASRFHSVVHAYKNGVPCVVLGWATKYKDLLHQFGQDRYMFDVRSLTSIDEMIMALDYMQQHYEEESATIAQALSAVQKKNVFDVLPKTLGRD